jgi:hypothetical protein
MDDVQNVIENMFHIDKNFIKKYQNKWFCIYLNVNFELLQSSKNVWTLGRIDCKTKIILVDCFKNKFWKSWILN